MILTKQKWVRKGVSGFALSLAIILVVTFQDAIEAYVNVINSVLGIIALWAFVHGWFVETRIHLRGQLFLYNVSRTLAKAVIAVATVLVIILLYKHDLFQQVNTSAETLDTLGKLDRFIFLSLRVFYDSQYVSFYAIPVIILAVWLTLKIIDNAYKELLIFSLSNWQKQIQVLYTEFCMAPTDRTLKRLLRYCLKVCTKIPDLSVGRLYNFPSRGDLMSAWLFVPDFKNQVFRVLQFEGPVGFLQDYKAIKKGFAVSFLKRREFKELCDKKLAGIITEEDFNQLKPKCISACGYIFAERLCRAYINLDDCVAFSHGYLEFIPPENVPG